MKLVINRCFGGYSLSTAAVQRLVELGDPVAMKYAASGLLSRVSNNMHNPEIERSNHLLVRVVEDLGASASGNLAQLVVVDIPDGVEFEMDEYDGIESIHEQHREWP